MRNSILIGLALLAIFAGGEAWAEKKYDPGVTDTEIKIGNVMPYSGPASAYAVIGRVEAAYFKMLNEQGGINARKINFISYDDGYSPPKTIEQVRRLIESDQVFLLFNVVGTPGNAAIQKYVNQKKVPHIFISSGGSRWNDPAHFPWSMAWWPSFRDEARVTPSTSSNITPARPSAFSTRTTIWEETTCQAFTRSSTPRRRSGSWPKSPMS